MKTRGIIYTITHAVTDWWMVSIFLLFYTIITWIIQILLQTKKFIRVILVKNCGLHTWELSQAICLLKMENRSCNPWLVKIMMPLIDADKWLTCPCQTKPQEGHERFISSFRHQNKLKVRRTVAVTEFYCFIFFSV